eukprot:2839017-Rhodomonas_salina.1
MSRTWWISLGMRGPLGACPSLPPASPSDPTPSLLSGGTTRCVSAGHRTVRKSEVGPAVPLRIGPLKFSSYSESRMSTHWRSCAFHQPLRGCEHRASRSKRVGR